MKRKQLLQEFSEFYEAERHRCPWAPANPRRVFELAQRLYANVYKQVTASRFMALVYDVLDGRGRTRKCPGLFDDFDPAKYASSLSLEDQFLKMFVQRLRANLARELHPRSDKGKPGDRERFRPRPWLGWFREERVSLQNQWAIEQVQDAVSRLPPEEQQVIQGKYWGDLSDSELARRLGMDRRTVRQRHEDGKEQVRAEFAR